MGGRLRELADGARLILGDRRLVEEGGAFESGVWEAEERALIETEGERMLLMGARERRRQWLKGVRCIELLLEIFREERCG